jgi:hypothetical protein
VKLALGQAVSLALSTLVLGLPSQAIAATPAVQSLSAPNSLNSSPSSKALPANPPLPPSRSDLRRLRTLAQRYRCATVSSTLSDEYDYAARYQFALTLNACLKQLQESIDSERTDLVSRADSAAFQRLRRRYAGYIAELEAQWSAIEPRPPIGQSDPDYVRLQAVVNQSRCISTTPELGQEPLTQQEFALLLDGCMNGINTAIAEGGADTIQWSDLESLRIIQERFAAELSILRGRTDALEAGV